MIDVVYNMEWTVNGKVDCSLFWSIYEKYYQTLNIAKIHFRSGPEIITKSLISSGGIGEELKWFRVPDKDLDFDIESVYKIEYICNDDEDDEPMDGVVEISVQSYWKDNEFDFETFWKVIGSIRLAPGYFYELIPRYSKEYISTFYIKKGSDRMLIVNGINCDVMNLRAIRIKQGVEGVVKDFDDAMRFLGAGL